MPSITPSHLLVAVAAMLALAGCGDKNSNVVFSQENGHSSGWATAHKTSAKANLESCAECHGENLDGGIAKVSCSLCHLGGSGAVHPSQWGNYAYARHNSYSTTQRTTSCATATCHGAALAGAGAAPNCATQCHLGGAYKKHPDGWTTISGHKSYLDTIGNVSTSCKTSACHGTDGRGVFLSGPACDQCHSMK
ncbi:MAG: hypothetical protein WC007_04985 [Pelobacteraceae bacterium]